MYVKRYQTYSSYLFRVIHPKRILILELVCLQRKENVGTIQV